MRNLKKELVKYSHLVAGEGLVAASSGNISVKQGGSILIKASGCFMEEAGIGDFLAVDLKTLGFCHSKLKPSCELKMHAVCYKGNAEIKCVMHTHPLYATTLINCSIDPEVLSPEFALSLGSGIEVIDYFCPGTEQLAESVGKAVKKANVVYLKNHGLLTVGKDLKQAYTRTVLAERMAKMQILSRLLGKRLKGISKGQAKKLIANLNPD